MDIEQPTNETNELLDATLEGFSITFVEDEIDFDLICEETLGNLKEGGIAQGKVTRISKDFVMVDIGYKSEGRIPIEEFEDVSGEQKIELNDPVEVYVEALEEDDGETLLSKEKARKLRIWETVGQVYEEQKTIEGIIAARIKGGLSVDIGIKAFLPGSQVDLRPVRNLDKLIGEKFEFSILKFNQKRGNIVLSRRALLEIDREKRRKETLEVLQEGASMKGHVKNITDYGVFIDLGGVDGLLHITDMTWGRIVHPSEMFEMGDEVEVLVLKYDNEEQKVSLGLKQKFPNPWDAVANKYPVGTRISGKIVSLTDYGAFIELEPGVEGLIHVSEMSWTKKIRNPSRFVSLADEVEAIVKDLDVEHKRISLSMKEATPNPWKQAVAKYPVGSVVSGNVRNVTDFGIFVGLDEGIDGLVHISDISWSQRQRRPADLVKKGDEIEVKILNIDVEQERLSLGIKQLTEDPWKNLDEKFQISSDVTGKIVNITDFGIFVEVLEGVEGLVHISEIDPAVPKAKLLDFYPIGTEVRTRVIKIDPEERRLGLSILESQTVVPPELQPEEAAPAEVAEDSSATLEETKSAASEQSVSAVEETKAEVAEPPATAEVVSESAEEAGNDTKAEDK
ncbi:MAG: 30S ribosomal protein S1 [SAR324 cluster bacterium]|nr:30S ribosomal protein S1 [SAR324 cluster bacterium]